MQPSQCSAAHSVFWCRQALTGGWRAGARNCSWQARPSRALPLARGWEEACDGRQMTYGPGSSLTMLLAGRTKCELPDLPGPLYKNTHLILTISLKSLRQTHISSGMGFTQIIVTNELLLRLKCSHTCTQDLHTDRQIHTCGDIYTVH